MEKKIKLPILIVGIILAVLIIASVILCVIPIQPFKPFNNYDRVVIMTSKDSNVGDITSAGNEDYQKAFDKAIKKANYSVMHSLLEFNVKYSPEFVYKTEKDKKDKDVIAKDADGNKIKKEMTYAEVKTACVPSETAYVLEFYFEQLRELKVDKTVIKYDAMRVAISTSEGQIKPMTIYLFNSNLTSGEGNSEVEQYRINPLTLNANTSPLYLALTDITTNLSK